MMMIPLVIPAESPDLAVRVQQLERALALSFDLLHALAERLESRLGPGFLGPELGRLVVGTAHAREQAAQIDALLRQGQQPTAARLVREWAGVTWDQAHALIGSWDSYPPEQRVRWLRLAAWVQAGGSQQAGEGESQAQQR